MGIKEKLGQMARNSIRLNIDGAEPYKRCGTRFGGRPDVPPGFVWPTFEGKRFDGEVKVRPLTFIAQFDCGELAPFDSERLLPDHGLLSFFYDADVQPWGYDPKDKGGARVFWFEDLSVLSPAEFPAEMEDYCKFPMVRVAAAQALSHPGPEDFFSGNWEDASKNEDEFEAAREELGGGDPGVCSKLLGWPDVIQNSMAVECDMVTQGYYLGSGWNDIPPNVRKRAEESAIDRWQLLFQLDTVETGDFCLMFGDSGRIYFYILKEDLLERRFDRAWLILQCC